MKCVPRKIAMARPKLGHWSDMSLAPMEIHILLWEPKFGIYIGIYRLEQQWNNWYAIDQTSGNYGTYRSCSPQYWQPLPKLPEFVEE
jgi:hypothetical protein